MRFMTSRRAWLAGAALAVALAPLSAQQAPAERIDYDAIYKIKDEGFQRSKVMETLSWLTDVYGPRLTNSPGFRKAGEWAVKEMTSWGLANVKLEPFPFGRGWSNDKFSMTATTPGGSFPVIGMATAWTPGTAGAVSADAVFAPLASEEDLAQFKGKLQGKVVFTQALRDVPATWTAPASRHTDKELEDLARETDATPRGRFGGRAGAPGRQGGPAAAGRGGAQSFAQTSRPVPERRGRRRHRHDRRPRRRGHAVRPGCRRREPPAQRRCGSSRRRRRRGALRPYRPRAAEEHAGEDRPGDPEHVPGGRHGVVQRDRRDPGHRQGRRGRDAGRALRLVARRDRGDGQCRRLGGDDGGDAHPEAVGPQAAAHGADRPVGRRGAGTDRVARIRHRALRQRRGHGAQAGAREVCRATSTWTTARARFAASICRATKPWRRSSRRG